MMLLLQTCFWVSSVRILEENDRDVRGLAASYYTGSCCNWTRLWYNYKRFSGSFVAMPGALHSTRKMYITRDQLRWTHVSAEN